MSKTAPFRVTSIAVFTALATLAGVAVAASPASSLTAAPRTQSAAAALTTVNGYASSVVGTWGNGGTVRGVFVPVRSIASSSKTYVQGTLMVTLRRADGTLLNGATRHDVAIPVNASGARRAATPAAAATCAILHLVLGPLDLNLLGLKVHLSRVVLDITAQQGPGNLLGNLLCAVANLLNGVNPPALNLLRLSNTLNRVISILT